MIPVSQAVKDLLNKNTSLSMGAGVIMDINVNSMVSFTPTSITGTEYQTINGRQPFKKLFPLDTIIKPSRPQLAGIKYGISGDVQAKTYADPKSVDYKPSAQSANVVKYRTYYPGNSVQYKYWLTPINTPASVAITYPKTVYANKVTLKFEISHAMPSAWTIVIGGTTVSGTSADIKSFTSTGNDAGTVSIYYNGTTWSKNASDINLSSFKSFTTLSMTATNPGGYIGVIELAPHYVTDVSQYIVDFDLRKESSASTEALVPVGNITANSLTLNLNAYRGSVSSGTIPFKSYSKSDTIDTSNIYFHKNAEINLFMKLYDSAGEFSDSRGNYYKIQQGVFYLDKWSISEFGDASLDLLDAAKTLQDTLAPDLLCEGYSSIAIIRRLLDSVGFTNYTFKYKENDNSIISPNYWWSDSQATVWENLQSLCRDSQMSAFVDEFGTLQFYTREYLFGTSDISWTFRYDALKDAQLNILEHANIESFTKTDLPSANQVKVVYYSTVTSAYEQSSAPLWSSGTSWLAAAALTEDLLKTELPTTSSKVYMKIKPITINTLSEEQVVYSFSGHFLLDSEVVEYDAIEYQYTDISTGLPQTIDITGESDLLKSRGKAAIVQNGPKFSTTFVPSGRYRIKTRGAFGTEVADHYVNAKNEASGWQGKVGAVWK
jgi:hypothetical protein